MFAFSTGTLYRLHGCRSTVFPGGRVRRSDIIAKNPKAPADMGLGGPVPRWLWWMALGVALLGLSVPKASAAGWITYQNAVLKSRAYNDGDSFHVRCGRANYVFRLYFVDAPETDSSFPKRVAEQAAYWDIDPAATLELGRRAAAFTRDYLKDGFTVHTRKEDARGRGESRRYFAIIQTDRGDLATALVAAGLARVYGKPTDLPDGRRGRSVMAGLRIEERRARREHRGGWAHTGSMGTATTRTWTSR